MWPSEDKEKVDENELSSQSEINADDASMKIA